MSFDTARKSPREVHLTSVTALALKPRGSYLPTPKPNGTAITESQFIPKVWALIVKDE